MLTHYQGANARHVFNARLFTKNQKIKTRILALMLEDNGASWQSNSEENCNIILNTDKTTEFEMDDGVVKTKRENLDPKK